MNKIQGKMVGAVLLGAAGGGLFGYALHTPEAPKVIEITREVEVPVERVVEVPVEVPVYVPQVNTDSGTCQEGDRCDWDGELHPCGWTTEEGVTENLDAYEERCGS